MNLFAVEAGTALAAAINLEDSLGQPVTTYVGTEPLEAEVWPGGNRAVSFAAEVEWASPEFGVINLLIPAELTIGLPTGRYSGRVVLIDSAAGPLLVAEFAIDLKAAPGLAVEPPTYCGYADLVDYGRTWLPELQGEDDEAGFAEYRARARAWLDDLILGAHRPRGGVSLGSPGFGAMLYGAGGATPNPWLRAQLDADLLIRRPWVVECTARKALALICDGQIGPTEAGDGYARVGRGYANEARALALSSTAEFAAEDGSTAFSIYLGGGSIR